MFLVVRVEGMSWGIVEAPRLSRLDPPPLQGDMFLVVRVEGMSWGTIEVPRLSRLDPPPSYVYRHVCFVVESPTTVWVCGVHMPTCLWCVVW